MPSGYIFLGFRDFLFFLNIFHVFYYRKKISKKKEDISPSRLVFIVATRWTGNKLFFKGGLTGPFDRPHFQVMPYPLHGTPCHQHIACLQTLAPQAGYREQKPHGGSKEVASRTCPNEDRHACVFMVVCYRIKGPKPFQTSLQDFF